MKFFTTKLHYAFVAFFMLTLTFGNAQTDSRSKALLDKHTAVIGKYEDLSSKKDVQFKYVYDNFDKGKDVSVEKIIFDGEHTWASYSQHERNVLPGQEGVALQSLVMGKPQLTLDGKMITDEKAMGGTVFIREVNVFWFSMIYKLQDAGTIHEYMGTEKVNGMEYDKVMLTYNNSVTGKPADDSYILYFNPETHMIDQFFFSLPALGVNEPIIKMTVDYEKIDGIYVPTSRKSYAPNPETGKYMINGEYTMSDVKFSNKFKVKDFILKGK